MQHCWPIDLVSGAAKAISNWRLRFDFVTVTCEGLILKATNADTHNQLFLRQSFYELRSEQVKKSSMVQHLAFGLNAGYPSIKMHIEHTRLSAEQNTAPDLASTKTLLSVFDQYGRPPAYYHQVIGLAQTAGLGGEATRLVVECITRYAGDGFQCSAEGAENTEASELSYGSMVNSLFKAK